MKPSTAKTLHLLRVRGVDGVSPAEARRWAGTDRLAARVAELRSEGYEVMTLREMVGGSSFARYVLRERPAPMAGVQETFAGWAPGEVAEVFGK
jgi:hypothetical protein